MPTVKPRYTITDTGEVEQLIDQAQQRWPGISDRKELLLRLAEVGREAIQSAGRDRRAVVRETAGALDGVYQRDELDRLRQDWPD